MIQVALRHEQEFSEQYVYAPEDLKRFTNLAPSVISINHKFTDERRRVESFIEGLFAEKYNAQVAEHYPYLMSVRDRDDKILAALGFRYAAQESLFLESYLDTPIEILLADNLGQEVSRSEITEVGSLASSGLGGYIFLFSALLTYMESQNQAYIASTVTQTLRRYFERLQIQPISLANADQTRLNDGGESWGRYYEANPQVAAGGVQGSQKIMSQLLPMSINRDSKLVSRLHLPLNQHSLTSNTVETQGD